MDRRYPIEDYGAIFDAHTHLYFDYHDGLMTPKQLIQSTKRRGFNFVCAMSHDTAVGTKIVARLAKEHDLPCLPGIEISTIHNHILAYGIQEWPFMRDTTKPDEAIDHLRDQDCAIFLSHPYSDAGLTPHTQWMPSVVKRLDIDGIEWVNATIYHQNLKTHRVYKRWPEGRRIAGSDAHHPAVFGFGYTQVAVNSEDPDDVVAAMQKGRCKPHWQIPSPVLPIYQVLLSVVKNKIVKRRMVEGKMAPAIGDRPGSIRPKKIPDAIEWREKLIRDRDPIERIVNWIDE